MHVRQAPHIVFSYVKGPLVSTLIPSKMQSLGEEMYSFLSFHSLIVENKGWRV